MQSTGSYVFLTILFIIVHALLFNFKRNRNSANSKDAENVLEKFHEYSQN